MKSSSLYLVLGSGRPAAPAEAVAAEAVEERTDEIRDSMLDLLMSVGKDFPRVAGYIRRATDVQALWFLRSELMAVLADTYGEAEARERLEAVSAMFDGMLPQGLRSRPSPLNCLNRHVRRGLL